MPIRVCLEFILARHGAVNLFRWNHILFRASVRQERDTVRLSMQRIKKPVVHAAKPHAQLVDAVTQRIRFRAAQLPPQLRQSRHFFAQLGNDAPILPATLHHEMCSTAPVCSNSGLRVARATNQPKPPPK